MIVFCFVSFKLFFFGSMQVILDKLCVRETDKVLPPEPIKTW